MQPYRPAARRDRRAASSPRFVQEVSDGATRVERRERERLNDGGVSGGHSLGSTLYPICGGEDTRDRAPRTGQHSASVVALDHRPRTPLEEDRGGSDDARRRESSRPSCGTATDGPRVLERRDQDAARRVAVLRTPDVRANLRQRDRVAVGDAQSVAQAASDPIGDVARPRLLSASIRPARDNETRDDAADEYTHHKSRRSEHRGCPQEPVHLGLRARDKRLLRAGLSNGLSADAARAETDELRDAERSNPQIKSYLRPTAAAEKGVKVVLSRNDIGRHLTSEMVFSGDRLQGFSDTIEHPDGLVLVDTGLIDTTPAIEDDGEEWHPNPLPDELVSRVAVVVNTHLHFDHCGGNRLFPGIPIHVQRRELADARTEDDYTVREWVDFPGATYVEHDGEAEILPGVRLLPAPDTRPDIRSSSWRPTKARSSSAATSATRSRTSNAGIRRASSSSSNSRRRPTSRMPRRCVSRTRGRSG